MITKIQCPYCNKTFTSIRGKNYVLASLKTHVKQTRNKGHNKYDKTPENFNPEQIEIKKLEL